MHGTKNKKHKKKSKNKKIVDFSEIVNEMRASSTLCSPGLSATMSGCVPHKQGGCPPPESPKEILFFFFSDHEKRSGNFLTRTSNPHFSILMNVPPTLVNVFSSNSGRCPPPVPVDPRLPPGPVHLPVGDEWETNVGWFEHHNPTN